MENLPQREQFAQIGTTFGSYEYVQPYFDVNLPVTSDGTVLFRITGDYTSASSYIDVVETDRYTINPTLLITNNSGTTLTINGRHTVGTLTLERSGGAPGILTHTANFTYDYSGNGSDVVAGMDLTVAGSLDIQGASGQLVASRIDV